MGIVSRCLFLCISQAPLAFRVVTQVDLDGRDVTGRQKIGARVGEERPLGAAATTGREGNGRTCHFPNCGTGPDLPLPARASLLSGF